MFLHKKKTHKTTKQKQTNVKNCEFCAAQNKILKEINLFKYLLILWLFIKKN